jgi:mannose-6-phosphate isomerase-like protein (cupin superfamily)
MQKRNAFDAMQWFAVLQTSNQSQTAVMRLEPGSWSGEKGNEHAGSEQVLLVLEGEVVAEIGKDRDVLKRGDAVIVPKGVDHRFGNEGNVPALTFNVYAPPAY